MCNLDLVIFARVCSCMRYWSSDEVLRIVCTLQWPIVAYCFWCCLWWCDILDLVQWIVCRAPIWCIGLCVVGCWDLVCHCTELLVIGTLFLGYAKCFADDMFCLKLLLVLMIIVLYFYWSCWCVDKHDLCIHDTCHWCLSCFLAHNADIGIQNFVLV